uniref:Protein kinase domain-containing protein n=1 Tax=Panagrolaimus sp. JU765 TaxID=591449 RepID=A0AC34REM7_9BILA
MEELKRSRMATALGDPQTSRRPEDFVYGQEIGRGAYGVVYDVREVKTGNLYVMKVNQFSTFQEGVPQSVIREISALMSIKELRHENIVLLHDAFITQKEGTATLSILYEKCDWDLHQFLKNIPRSMGERQIKWFTYQIFSGLEFLHSHSIIHRDIKPENILVNKSQNVKIADFGLARNLSLHSTYTPTVVTLWYRSPELLLQCEYNSAVDIWSGGCIIYELFTRKPLFPGKTESETLFMILEKMGTPAKEEWPSDAVVEHSTFRQTPKRSIVEHATMLLDHPEATQLIDSVLAFEPRHRPSANSFISKPWFDEFRFNPPNFTATT